ncbi:hypothetical protein Tco_0065012 [Tanacetum coccineum]
MRPRRLLILLSDFDCKIRYHPREASIAADALSRIERAKPLRMRALVMTINLYLPPQIHKAQVESLKTEKDKDQNLQGMDKELRLVLIELPALGAGVGYHACTNGPNIEAGFATRNTPLEMGKHSHVFYHKTTKNNKQLRHDLGNRDHQKSYADVRRKPLEFHVEVKVGTVTYRLEPLEQLSRIYSTFHVSNLKKYLSGETLAIQLDEIQIDDTLYSIEEPVEIMNHEVKRLKQSHIPIVKVVTVACDGGEGGCRGGGLGGAVAVAVTSRGEAAAGVGGVVKAAVEVAAGCGSGGWRRICDWWDGGV